MFPQHNNTTGVRNRRNIRETMVPLLRDPTAVEERKLLCCMMG